MIINPCDSEASDEVRALLRYFNSIEGKGILTGQHTQSVPQEELEYISKVTNGKLPAVCGFELLGYSPNINRADSSEACLKEVDEVYGTIETAMNWAKRGGIVTYTWHWFSPIGGRDKAFYAEHTDFDASKAANAGTPEYEAMIKDLDYMAELLKPFQERKIPILWRPFHESEGKWFWWGAKGPEVAAKLYRIMFDYFTKEKDLHNLLWVWNCPLKEGYVGDEYCDIISRDIYPPAHAHSSFKKEYEELLSITEAHKGAALAENGVLPAMDELISDKVNWLWYMTWSHEFCMSEEYNNADVLKNLYNHPYSITLDMLPWKEHIEF